MTVFTVLLAALPMFRQIVTTEWPDERSAAAATAAKTLLGPGDRFVFSARWDDRHPRALALARALAPTGLKSTFYVCGTGEAFTPTLRALTALGNSVGCHTITHDWMCRLLPMKVFREILQNRIELEVQSRTPVVTFGIPYGWGALQTEASGYDQIAVLGQALSNAGLLGGSEGDGNAGARYGLSTNEWVGSHIFFANDREPDAARFRAGLSALTNSLAKKDFPCGPHVSLGIHPWQSDAGMVRLAAMVAEAAAVPGTVMMNDNEYVATRLQYLHASVTKIGVDGRTVRFAVDRPEPAVIGAAMPLKLKLSDGRVIDVAPPEKHGVPVTYAHVDGALAVSSDGRSFTLDFTNTCVTAMEDVSFTLRLPPGYRPGVLERRMPSLAPGKPVRLTFAAALPDREIFREGTLYAAVEINARGRRIWASVEKKSAVGETDSPRDRAVFLPTMPMTNAPSAAAFAAMSVPGAELSGGWRRADGSAEGDAPWAVTAYVRGDGPRARKYAGWSLPRPGEEKCYALVFDFTADTRLHGEKWTCVFTGGHVKPKNVGAWLNGVYRADPAGSMKLRDGRNRLLVRLTEIDADMLRTVLDIRSAKDASPVSFTKIGL